MDSSRCTSGYYRASCASFEASHPQHQWVAVISISAIVDIAGAAIGLLIFPPPRSEHSAFQRSLNPPTRLLDVVLIAAISGYLRLLSLTRKLDPEFS